MTTECLYTKLMGFHEKGHEILTKGFENNECFQLQSKQLYLKSLCLYIEEM